MYEFWYDYLKPKKYGEKVKLCFMDTDSFIYHVKTEDIHKDIAEDVETRFDTSNNEIDRPLLMKKSKWLGNERLIRLTNHEKICWTKSKNI